MFVLERETERLNEMQGGASRETQPADGPGIVGNFWSDENDVEHLP